MELVPHASAAGAVSPRARLIGRILSVLAVLLLVFSGGVKVLLLPPALESFDQLGYPRSVAFGIGVLELACTLLYVWPRTSIYGAVLLTGYLGGAVATHLRLLDPWLSHTLFPLYVGAFLWGGLLLRDARLRALVASIQARAAPSP